MKQFLFLDAAQTCQNKKILLQKKKYKDQIISHYHITEQHQKELKHSQGDYFTIKFTEDVLNSKSNLLEKELEKVIQSFLKKYHKTKPILIVGLGNSEILVDSLGSNVTGQMIASNQYNDFLTIPKVALLNPEVIGKTGISSFKLIRFVVQDLKPDLMIIIDSLATSDLTSLNRVIEINDTGIIPGSALRTNKEITKKTFGIPILSIGVPFLYKNENNLFESIYLKKDMEKLSNIIANSLNQSILF